MKKIFLLFTVSAILAACGGEQDPKAKLAALKTQQAEINQQIEALEKELAISDTTSSKKIKDVIVTTLTPAPFVQYIDVQGTVDADESVDIRPTMMGSVTKIYVNEGDMVKSGQLLAELEHDVYIKQIKSLEPQLSAATDVYNRLKKLWEQKIGTEVQLIQAKAQKESLEKQIESLQEQVELSKIKSPISGTVDFVGLKIGQFATAAAMDPAFRVVNMGKLKVKANIAEAYVSKVKTGNEVTLFIPDLNKTLPSRVSFVAKVIDPLTRSFTTEAALSGENNQYHPNQLAIMKIIAYKNDNAISIPINLVQNSGTEQFVFIATNENGNKVAKKRAVKVGAVYEGNAEILEGLAAGEMIVSTGASDLADGLLINF